MPSDLELSELAALQSLAVAVQAQMRKADASLTNSGLQQVAASVRAHGYPGLIVAASLGQATGATTCYLVLQDDGVLVTWGTHDSHSRTGCLVTRSDIRVRTILM